MALPFTPQFQGEEKVPGKGRDQGDAHIWTPDGYHYDFQGVGEFIALTSTSGDLEVQVRMQPWGSSKTVSINTAVAMNVNGDTVGVYLGQDPPLRINHQPVALDGQAKRLLNGGHVEQHGTDFSVVWPDQSEVTVFLRGYNGLVDFTFSLCPPRSGKIAGLFGNYDSDPRNDLTSSSGVVVQGAGGSEDFSQQLYGIFGNSWRISQSKSLLEYAPGQDTTTFTDLKFPTKNNLLADLSAAQMQKAEMLCRQAGVIDSTSLNDCIYDVGFTDDGRFADSAAKTAAAVKTDAVPLLLNCTIYPIGGGWCTDNPSIPGGVRAGTTYQLRVETVIASSGNTVESFTCGPITSALTALCRFETQGMLFQGGSIIRQYTLTTGALQEFTTQVICKPSKPEGTRC